MFCMQPVNSHNSLKHSTYLLFVCPKEPLKNAPAVALKAHKCVLTLVQCS
jgi:hypothetical protein